MKLRIRQMLVYVAYHFGKQAYLWLWHCLLLPLASLFTKHPTRSSSVSDVGLFGAVHGRRQLGGIKGDPIGAQLICNFCLLWVFWTRTTGR